MLQTVYTHLKSLSKFYSKTSIAPAAAFLPRPGWSIQDHGVCTVAKCIESCYGKDKRCLTVEDWREQKTPGAKAQMGPTSGEKSPVMLSAGPNSRIQPRTAILVLPGNKQYTRGKLQHHSRTKYENSRSTVIGQHNDKHDYLPIR